MSLIDYQKALFIWVSVVFTVFEDDDERVYREALGAGAR
ncbi:hypothetical protein H4687_008722 [Streptomyces stelliscabiei]|uniref:Uncharacterized protein n=1 Tax=Streptomyces stelliscabiei TaxID=146820 RepID=A0A8I0PAN3_9ACTN|nr:hypothetical protein [Streptomyces stelliscabiei]